ncbi:hypothetical protein GCM10025331_59240 [Actinoplanes utahensis]|nr:hypothetical protein Aut01nite_70060 [Actinoplanes utahensis]
MTQPRAGRYEDLDVVQEQPLPWRVPSVYVSINGGAARRCKVTRHPGDLLGLDLPGVRVAPGSIAEIQWTQNGRGAYIAGTIVDTPMGAVRGLYLRVDESVTNIQRRLGVRVEVQIPVVITLPSGRMVPAHTEDLSVGGAHVSVDLSQIDGPAIRQLAEELVVGEHVVAECGFPDGLARFSALVADVGHEPGDARLRFVDIDTGTEERLTSFLAGAQRKAAARKRKPGAG